MGDDLAAMTELLGAIKLRITEIVLKEDRPIYVPDILWQLESSLVLGKFMIQI